MNPCLPMQQTARDLLTALRERNFPKVTAHASRLVAPLGVLYSTAIPATMPAQKHEDKITGPLVMDLDRCLEEVETMPTHSGLRGVVWNGEWLESLLRFLLAVIKGKPSATPPSDLAVTRDVPPMMGSPRDGGGSTRGP